MEMLVKRSPGPEFNAITQITFRELHFHFQEHLFPETKYNGLATDYHNPNKNNTPAINGVLLL